MARLTIKIKEQIAANAVAKAGVNAALSALCKRRAELAEQVRLFAWGGEENAKAAKAFVVKVTKLLKKAPKGVRGSAPSAGYPENRIDAAFGGLQTSIPFNGGEGDKVSRRTTYDRVLLAADHELTTEFNAIEAGQQRLNDQKIEITAQVRAACEKVTTLEKLLKIWPEAVELVPKEVKPASTALALATKDLNKLIGLGGE